MGIFDGFKKIVTKTSGEDIANVHDSDRLLKTYMQKVETINSFESKLERLSDAELQSKTIEFKQKISSGISIDLILPEAFAVVREASWRILELRHFDVQVRYFCVICLQ